MAEAEKGWRRGSMNVSFIFISSWTYLSSLDMISNSTSCRVRSREPRLETRSSSVTSLQDWAESMRLLPSEGAVETGVPERRDAAEPCMEGDVVRTDALALALVEPTSVLEDDAPVEARGFSPWAA